MNGGEGGEAEIQSRKAFFEFSANFFITMANFMDHLADEVLPAIIQKLSSQ